MREIWAKGALLLQSLKCKPGPGASIVKPSVGAGRTVITTTLHQCVAKGGALSPSRPPRFLFLPRVSNFSTLETGLVIWVLPRFMSPLPATCLEMLIKATFLSLSWHDFLEPLHIKHFSSWYNTTVFSCPSVGPSQLLSSSAPNEGELYISCLRPFSHRLASQPNAVSDHPHCCSLHPPTCREPLRGTQRL